MKRPHPDVPSHAVVLHQLEDVPIALPRPGTPGHRGLWLAQQLTDSPAPFLLLTGMRLTRTWRELGQLLEDSGQPDHPFLSLAAEAAHAASTVITLHVTATDQDRYGMTERDFRLQLETLQSAVQEVVQRHNRLLGMLPPTQ